MTPSLQLVAAIGLHIKAGLEMLVDILAVGVVTSSAMYCSGSCKTRCCNKTESDTHFGTARFKAAIKHDKVLGVAISRKHIC